MTAQFFNTQTNTSPHIIGASWLIEMGGVQCADDAENITAVPNGAIAILNGAIVDIGDYTKLTNKHPNATSEFFDGQILLPGLINCHGHAAMSLYRGYADDLPLHQWLEDHIWPAEAMHTDADFVADGTTLAIAEMLMSGTTTFSDMYFYPDVVAKTANALGMRAQITFPVLEFPSAWANDASSYIEKGLALLDDYKYSDQIIIGFGPHAPYTVSNTSFEKIMMLAEEVDAPVQLHLHETEQEILDSLNQFGVSPIKRLAEIGVLSPRTQAVHLTQLDDNDREILTRTDSSVIHCPTSNLKLASGYCDIFALNKSGIRVGFGTDSAASNNTLNMFDTLRTAALLAKHHHRDASVLSAKTALYHATLGGAKALGIDNLTGSISIGKQADIIAIDCNHPALQPMHQPISQLVYAQTATAVSSVWINGEQKVKNGALVDIHLPELLHRVRARTTQLFAPQKH